MGGANPCPAHPPSAPTSARAAETTRSICSMRNGLASQRLTGEEYLISRLEGLRAEARLLAEDEYDGEEMWRFIRDAAALFERFLQTATLNQPPANTKLFHLINALEQDGASTEVREALHAVRDTANDGKHDASTNTSYRRIDGLLADAEEAVRELAQLGIPEVANAFDPPYRRRFLIAVYDHLAGGESEFYVWPAGQEPRGTGLGGPRELDSFQFHFRDEEKVRAQLARSGDLTFGDVDPEIVAALRADAEYTEAGYWEGSYRDLVTACAPHQHDMELLPGLARHDQVGAVRAALAMTMVDVLQPVPAPGERPNEQDLLAHAAMHYAVSRQTPATAAVAPRFAQFVANLPHQGALLRGPRWLNAGSFAELVPRAVMIEEELGIALLPDGTLVAKVEP